MPKRELRHACLRNDTVVQTASNNRGYVMPIRKPIIIPAVIAMLSPQLARAVEGTLYWTTVNPSIRFSDLANPQSQLLTNTPSQTIGIAIAPESDLMVWSGKVPDGMYRSRMDGSDIALIVPPCGPSALCSIGLDIEIELTQQRIYWSESGSGSQYYALKRANFDGNGIEDVLNIPLTRPNALELDIANQKIYWGEGILGQQAGRIRRANFDGTQVENLLNVGWHTPALEMDFENGKMYWTSNNEGEIWRANLDGTQSELLMSGLTNPLGLQLDLFNGQMYWGDHGAGIIGRANLDGSGAEIFLTTPTAQVAGLALHVVPEPAVTLSLLLGSAIAFGRRKRPDRRS